MKAERSGHALTYLFTWMIHLLCPEDLTVTFISVSNRRSPCFVSCLKPDRWAAVDSLTCPSPPPLRQLCSALQSLGCELSSAFAVPFVFNRSCGPQGEEHTRFGEVMRSVCIGRDGRREENQIVLFYHCPIFPALLSTYTFPCIHVHESFLLLSIRPW